MSSVNKVVLVGRLGQDPTTRFTSSGQTVTNFSMATGERFKTRDGEQKETTEWHNIVAWGKLAEICQKFLHKGSLVYVEGKIQSREYEARDGGKKKAFEIVISDMKMLDKRAADSSSEVEQPVAAGITDDDIPF